MLFIRSRSSPSAPVLHESARSRTAVIERSRRPRIALTMISPVCAWNDVLVLCRVGVVEPARVHQRADSHERATTLRVGWCEVGERVVQGVVYEPAATWEGGGACALVVEGGVSVHNDRVLAGQQSALVRGAWATRFIKHHISTQIIMITSIYFLLNEKHFCHCSLSKCIREFVLADEELSGI